MHGPQLSRRAFLMAGSGAVLLAACGGGDDDTTATTAAPEPTTSAPAAQFSLVSLFDINALLVSGSPQRAPVAIGDARGVLVKDPPATLEFAMFLDNEPFGSPITVASHSADLPRAYYPLVFTPSASGTYTAVTEVNGAQVNASFRVSDPGAVAVPQPGQPFPVFDTPTPGDDHGVSPICTADPPCPLHDVNLSQTVGHAPTVLLVSTPKFCQVAICGPVLDVLLSRRAQRPDVQMIHAEVYADNTASTPSHAAPVMEALSLAYEPALFAVAADGTLKARLDNIYDSAELDAALALL